MPKKNVVIRGQRSKLNLFDDFIAEQQIEELISLYPFPYSEEAIKLGFEEFGNVVELANTPASQAGD